MFGRPRRRLADLTTRRRAWLTGVTALVLVSAALGATTAAGADDDRCQAREYFVSPDGSDHKGPGDESRPWRTVQHARDYIRGQRDTDAMGCDIVVNIRAGDYIVDETITFTEADSGSNGHSVVYRSYDGPGQARFLGARPVTGWEPYDGQIYRARVDRGEPFHTLYEGGRRATTAREPNRRSDEEWAPYFVSGPARPDRTGTQSQLWFNTGEWDQSWDLSQAQVVIWSGGRWAWFTDTVPIQSVNWGRNQVHLDYWTRYHTSNDERGSRYFLQNSLDLLDQPGEYHYDHDDGMLYYWPRSGSIDDATVWAPTVRTILDIAGSSPTARVHDLRFQGLALAYTDFVDWYRYGWISKGDSGERRAYPIYDRQVELPRNRFGAVTLTNTRHIDLRDLHIANTGFTAVFLLFANDHVTVSGSLLEYLGGDGIKVEGPYPGDGDLAHDNVFTNNYIHHVGELVPGDASGVEIQNSGSNEVSHSVIEHSARYAVSLRTRPEIPNEDNYASGNALEYLRIAHVGKDSGDTGAIYAYAVHNEEPHLPPTSVLNQITIDDVHADPSMEDGPPHGVHMDFGGCGFRFSNIEVSNVQGDAYHNGKGCNVKENVSWEADFDASRMQYDQIGVTDDFPYPTPNP
ncbi:right-handed parallel beta-helix repeat-containing protein [Actinopolymorpha sp. B11F2]|uniref:right-handed parallel beta-helix repeat-containing protein n=1 Tax=Actinopolymorpha sp. B11F2 TaxID=3160862 RepID=UPI0032E5310B